MSASVPGAPAAPSGAISPVGIVMIAVVIAAAAVILYAMGRVPICKCGTIKFWHGVTNSSENSQHVTDWYTFSHIIHGFLFYSAYWLAQKITGRRLALFYGLLGAVIVESAWEILENTPMIIERYRTATVSLDYFGDSVLNSVADILSMIAGFFFAALAPVALTIALALVMEIGVFMMIRDNLLLNIIMLVYPLDSIKAWQAGA
ncbi:MAG: DUF2585 domain-containing protein [Beijerinckiaceae bacterium]